MLHDADRMLRGEVIYRDFMEMTFPGVQLLFLALFKFFGPRIWIPDALLVLLGIGFTLLLYAISRKILSARRAPLPAIAFLTLIYHERLDATHHWFSILLILAALALTMDSRALGRIFLAGLLFGFSTCFTQSHGSMALAAFVLFLWLERDSQAASEHCLVRSYVVLLSGYSLPLLLIVGPVILSVGWTRFLYCTCIYLFKYAPSLQIGNDWRGYMVGLSPVVHSLLPWKVATFLLVHATVPLIYILVLVRYASGTLCENPVLRTRLLQIAMVGLLLFLSVASSPTWARLYYVCFPALLLFCWWLEQAGRKGQWFLHAVYWTSITLMVVYPVTTQFRKYEFLNLSRGRTAFRSRQAFSRYQWVAGRTHPGDYFFGGFYPDFYFLLDLKNPGPIPYVSPDDSTRPEEVAATIKSIEFHQVRLILWASELDLPPIPERDHLASLRAYVWGHYHIVKSFPTYQAWSRNVGEQDQK